MSDYITRTPYQPPSFAELSAQGALVPGQTKPYYDKTVEKLHHVRGVDVFDITYPSDGLKITGVEALPKLKPGEKVPLIIYNRGGSGNFGRLSTPQVLYNIIPLAQRMHAGVLASNYRGNAGSEGREEWGGKDLNDIRNLIELGTRQPWWDGKHIFMLGWSRGGMMTYLSLKHGFPVTAAAVGAGAADIASGNARRPEMEEVCKRFIPEFQATRDQALFDRSAVCWPEKINTPVLILHGDADDRVHVDEARTLYQKLAELKKPVRYVEYPGGDHGLRHYYEAYMKEIVTWFDAHRHRDVAQSV